ncbi:transporter [Azospirillum soli]|uniref:transporter n=1 Tax=Azospirillum soli TaxID=1304799 RepID=UPI001AE9A99D|nr:transporter [Azospirillum soli]MBP2315623.1 hypothetical protein [Azospirillum soli]
MKRLIPAILLVASCAGTDPRVAELEHQLRDRDAEIAALRQQLGSNNLPREQAAAPRPPSSGQPASNVPEEETSRALEQALVRQGGSVLARGTVQVEPELSYVYSEPTKGFRRDTFGSAGTVRVGLPWDMQADLRVPVVIHDRLKQGGTSAGLGDISLGLTKSVVVERDYVPELLVFGNWQAPTGRSDAIPPTGSGAHAVQAGVTAVKRKDPVALYGSLSYTWNGRSSDFDYGDTLGGTLGVILAATPDTSILADVNLNSHFASRVGGQAITQSDRLIGTFELGAATVMGRDLLLNVTAGVGFTPAAPDFRLTVSLPKRF